MPKNMQRELIKTRQNLTECLAETMPSKEFRATIIMAMIGLHRIEDQIRNSQNIEERRQLTHEFNTGKTSIEKGIRLLRKSINRSSKDSGETFRRAMP